MWIATRHGFFSIVRAHADQPAGIAPHTPKQPHDDLLMVRARCRGHLEALIAAHREIRFGDIRENTGTDYPFRCIVHQDEITSLAVLLADAIDYINFKDEAKACRPDDEEYQTFLRGTWAGGIAMEPKPPGGHAVSWFADYALDTGRAPGSRTQYFGGGAAIPPQAQLDSDGVGCLECDDDPEMYMEFNGHACPSCTVDHHEPCNMDEA